MKTNSPLRFLKAKYITFGCKLNFAETSSLADTLQEHGIFETTDDVPDIIIVNTCSVTAVSDRKCRQTIRSLSRRFPYAGIIVTGCYAQLKPDEAAGLPGVVLVVGNDRKNSIPQMALQWLEERENRVLIEKAKNFSGFEHSCSKGNRTRYFLKVQDGCNYFCSYCTIPYARGKSRSPKIDELVNMAEAVAREGGKEIVLTGVNVGDFGRGSDESFLQLIKALDMVEGIERYRISSIEPNLLTDEIINFVAGSKHFMPHFHIPLQCGDNEVLKLMRRHYDTEIFANRVATIRKYIPDAFIGVDLIVGMRGETPERFENSYNFVEKLDVSRLHVFPYSERPGTAALNISPRVNPEEKQRRMARMLEMSRRKEKDFSRRFVSQVRPVLFETFDTELKMVEGHTDNYIKIKAPATENIETNRIYEVRVGTSRPENGEGMVSDGKIVNYE